MVSRQAVVTGGRTWWLVVHVVVAFAAGGCRENRGGADHKGRVLERSIGIKTIDNQYTELIPAGKSLPVIWSNVFANGLDGQTSVEVTLAQRGPVGIELISSVVIPDLPPRPKAKLLVVVTVTVDLEKRLQVRATVTETGYVRNFGPFPVN